MEILTGRQIWNGGCEPEKTARAVRSRRISYPATDGKG